jgi:hypothetical protein
MPIGKVEAGVKVECETTWWVELESPYRTGGLDTYIIGNCGEAFDL